MDIHLRQSGRSSSNTPPASDLLSHPRGTLKSCCSSCSKIEETKLSTCAVFGIARRGLGLGLGFKRHELRMCIFEGHSSIHIQFSSCQSLQHQFIKHHFIKHQFIKHQFIKHQFIKHQLTKAQNLSKPCLVISRQTLVIFDQRNPHHWLHDVQNRESRDMNTMLRLKR